MFFSHRKSFFVKELKFSNSNSKNSQFEIIWKMNDGLSQDRTFLIDSFWFFYFFLFYFIFVTFSEVAKFVWIRFLFFLPSFIHFYISSSESFPYLVWFGLVQFGLVWLSFGSFWFGSVWFGLVQFWFSLVKFWSE